MLPALQSLIILQERDRKLHDAKQDISLIPQEANKIKEGLAKKIQALNAAKARYMEAKKAVQQVDLDRQTRKETITKLKMRQGETKRNEEYQMLSHKIVEYNEQIDDLETKELELMEKVDAAKQARLAAASALEEEKAYATELSQKLVQRKKNMQSKQQELSKDRDVLAAKVPADALELYDRIRGASGVNAVTVMTPTGQCTGCHMKLPPATLHQVQSGKELVQCGECSRILYIA